MPILVPSLMGGIELVTEKKIQLDLLKLMRSLSIVQILSVKKDISSQKSNILT